MLNSFDIFRRALGSLAATFALVALLAQPAAADAVLSTPETVVPAQVAPTDIAKTGLASAAIAQAAIAQAENGANDPIEGLNRFIFAFNEFLYAIVLRPLAEIYVLVVPDPARDGVRNFLTNLRTPVVLANDLLQGEGDRAWITTQRFFINSTVGVGGLFDVAKGWGLEGHKEDLGQTFAVWGVPDGFYLVLPILGPSNPRDAAGKFLDSFLDPLSYYLTNTDREEYDIARSVTLGVDEYSRVMDQLQKLQDTSVDYYAALRSISRQKRAADIRNGEVKDGVPLPDLKYDFNAELRPR